MLSSLRSKPSLFINLDSHPLLPLKLSSEIEDEFSTNCTNAIYSFSFTIWPEHSSKHEGLFNYQSSHDSDASLLTHRYPLSHSQCYFRPIASAEALSVLVSRCRFYRSLKCLKEIKNLRFNQKTLRDFAEYLCISYPFPNHLEEYSFLHSKYFCPLSNGQLLWR